MVTMLETAAKIIVCALLATCLAALGWSYAGRLQPVDDAITKSAKMHCASYTPFRGNEYPGDPTYHADPKLIEEDLTLLAKSFDCVRTYTADQGIDQVLPIARKVGLRVYAGAWIGRDAADAEKELARTIKAVTANADVVDGVIVGNEVLLRGELPQAKLKELILRVKQAVAPIPVTYADVWEFWLENKELAEAVDFITVHILPYWENEPTPVDSAITHVTDVLKRIGAAFPGKHILIGETGWPSKGRMREGAKPSLVDQAIYNRAIISYTEAHDIDTNLVEAFDQPWKRKDEGTVGGNWGIYDTNRQLKQGLTGPVSNFPNWRWQAAISGLISLGLAFVCIMANRRARWHQVIMLAPLGALAGAMLTISGGDLIHARPTIPDMAGGALGLVLIAATAVVAGLHWLERDSYRGPVLADQLLQRPWWRLGLAPDAWFGLARLGAMIGILSIALGQIFDPRYRDFPVEVYVVPAFVFTVEILRRQRWAFAAAEPVEGFLSWALLICAAIIFAREGRLNLHAIGFVVMMILLGSRILFAGRRIRIL
jgi:glucan 1,3-beta-glucosidase